MKSLKNLKVQPRLTIFTGKNVDEGTFGKGVAMLLRGVDTLGSLNRSAKDMHMAYSKAWRIIKETEEGFGFLLITREGARGSYLTDTGRKVLDIYEQLEQETTDFLEKRFDELRA
jgi:molybdate transport system regulatory protein